jgi:hypothetical protein
MKFLCIDIETSGPYVTQNEIIAIGTCYINSENESIIEIKRFTFDYSDEKFNEQTYAEFWQHHQDKLAVFKNDKKSTINHFADYVDTLQTNEKDLIIISDNPQFDIGFINYYYETILKRKPLCYTKNGKYQLIVDQNTYLWAMLPEQKSPWVLDATINKKYNLQVIYQSDHYPENDATNICWMLIKAIQHNKN